MPISPKPKQVIRAETKDVEPITRQGRWMTVTLSLEDFVLIMRLMERDKLYDLQLYTFCSALEQRLGHTPRDFDKDRRLCRTAFTLYPPSHPLSFQVLRWFAQIIGTMVFRLEDNAKTEDLNEAITVIRKVLPAKSLPPAERRLMTIIMVRSLKLRYERLGDPKDLEDAIKHSELVLGLYPPSDILGRANVHHNLAIMLQHRPMNLDRTYLTPILYHLRQGNKLLPYGHTTRSAYSGLLCDLLEQDLERTGDFTAASEIAELQEEVLDSYPVGNPSRFQLLLKYGRSRFFFYTEQNDAAHLDAAHNYLNQALQQIPLDQANERARALLGLSVVCQARIREFGQKKDADHGVEHARKALELCPPGHSLHSECLGTITSSLTRRYSLLGDPNDLQESIRCGRANVALSRDDDDPTPLLHLSGSLQDRFLPEVGDVNNVIEAIELARKGVVLARSKRPDLVAFLLKVLADALTSRYKQAGEMADLDEAIERFREVMQLFGTNTPEHFVALCDLSDTVAIRYDVLQDPNDLDESIKLLNRAADLKPNPYKLATITTSLTMQHISATLEQTGLNLEHLDKTVLMCRLAVERSLESGPEHASNLCHLAEALQIRGVERNSVEDLDEAIGCLEIVVKYPRPWLGLHSLGYARLRRFELTKDTRDLDEAAIVLHQVEANVPEHLPPRGLISCILGRVYSRRGSPSDLEKAFAYLNKAANHSPMGTREQLQVALCWAWEAREHHHQSTILAYSTSLSLLERYIMASHTIDAQQKRLTDTYQLLPSIAASYAISEGQPETAMELLEQGRAMVWAQVGRYRSTLDRLNVMNPSLAAEFRSLSLRLERGVISTTAITDDQNASTYRSQLNRWTALLERIREEEGFSDFLKATPFTTLRQAAAHGPVIVVNIDQYRSDAIIIQHSSSPIIVPLPDATPPCIISLVVDLIKAVRLEGEGVSEKMKSAKITKVLRTLWDIIVQPIVEELQSSCGLVDGSRIWWCPTSSLWSLPLHAAGPFKAGSKNLPDIFVSSYTPTLSALIRSANRHPDRISQNQPQLLVVGQSQTPGQSPLPCVAEEIHQVQKLVPSVNILNEEAATKDAVISGLQKSAWIHFACHGSQDLVRPFNSHFVLHDKPLPLLDIIQTGLPNAEFAFLSACHSAAGDRRRPNEAIHLASGLQFSGFGSVIGTMWAMTDSDGPVMAKEFYKYMFRNGGGAADYRDAAVGLNLATKMLRRMKVPVSRWINFIHIGA